VCIFASCAVAKSLCSQNCLSTSTLSICRWFVPTWGQWNNTKFTLNRDNIDGTSGVVCTNKEHDQDSTHLLTFSPQWSGHGTSVKRHIFSLWLSSFRLLKTIPHPHTTSAIGHVAVWASISLRLTAMRHCLQLIWISWQIFKWSFAECKGNFALHHLHCPSTILRKLLAKWFLQKVSTGSRHFSHFTCFPEFSDLKMFTQNPQKVCPHGITNSASNNGFLL